MIDWGRVGELRREVGEEDFAEIAALFLEEAGETLERMEGHGSSDWEGDFHFLKSAALNIGFSDLARLCQQAEARAREGGGGGGGGAEDVPAVAAIFRASKSAFALGPPA